MCNTYLLELCLIGIVGGLGGNLVLPNLPAFVPLMEFITPFDYPTTKELNGTYALAHKSLDQKARRLNSPTSKLCPDTKLEPNFAKSNFSFCWVHLNAPTSAMDANLR